MPLSYTINKHGYAGYAHGCRCEICGIGKLEYQRDLRMRKGEINWRDRRNRTSKYGDGGPPDEMEPTSTPDVLAAFRERFGGRA